MKKKTPQADKPFPFRMTGLDGNAFSILGRFDQQARRAGWTDAQIAKVCAEATEGDYDHLLATMTKYTDAS